MTNNDIPRRFNPRRSVIAIRIERWSIIIGIILAALFAIVGTEFVGPGGVAHHCANVLNNGGSDSVEAIHCKRIAGN